MSLTPKLPFQKLFERSEGKTEKRRDQCSEGLDECPDQGLETALKDRVEDAGGHKEDQK